MNDKILIVIFIFCLLFGGAILSFILALTKWLLIAMYLHLKEVIFYDIFYSDTNKNT